uniref:PA domain-containing protein n=1 Tax=Chlamydomonas euryale TaxID=1486919 RepID=A0A6U2CU81_9CHLO|mmetsp:Transcript_16729/g.50078  ORF Transcript_16729/g.50078 Transcript_16729/m.50078 type:complete len:485 (+) Transcript_16729:72-1526(+)
MCGSAASRLDASALSPRPRRQHLSPTQAVPCTALLLLLPLLHVLLLLSPASAGSPTRDSCAGPLATLSPAGGTQLPAEHGLSDVGTISFGTLDLGAGGFPVFGVFAPFGQQLNDDETVAGPLALADPRDACSSLDVDSVQGAILLVERGGCSFTDKAAAAAAAGAAAMLLYDNQTGCISMGYRNESETLGLDLPCISITQESGDLLAAIAAEHRQLKFVLAAAKRAVLDPSSLLLWAMAVGTLVGGAIWSGFDHDASSKASPQTADEPRAHIVTEESVTITAKGAIGFMLLATAMLLTIFFLRSEAVFYVLLVLFSLGAFQSTTVALAVVVRAWLPFAARRAVQVPLLGSCQGEEVVAAAPAAACVAVWLAFRSADWAWMLQDFLGICLMLLFIRSLRVSSLCVAALLLGLAFVYDVFFVFLEPLIFGGDSVMVTVRTSPPGMLAQHAPPAYACLRPCKARTRKSYTEAQTMHGGSNHARSWNA